MGKEKWGAFMGLLTGGIPGAIAGYAIAKSIPEHVFEGWLNDLDATLSQAQQLQRAGQAIPPELCQRFTAQWLQAQRALQHSAYINQQRYETNVSGMLGQAASLGIDTSGISY